MADPAQTTTQVSQSTSIENELGSYRAVSGLAVTSLLLGLLGALSFASRSFLPAAAAAVVVGALALRSIRRYPDLLTGRRLAEIGIALGLVCGLSSFTFGYVREKVIERQAAVFARQYVETLNTKDFAQIFFLQMPESERKTTNPTKFLQEIQEQSAGAFESDPRVVVIKDLTTRLSRSPDEEAHFVKVEDIGFEGTKPVAFAVLELDGPAAEREPQARHALLKLGASDTDGRRTWHVVEVRYPYTSGSMATVVESAHGHDH